MIGIFILLAFAIIAVTILKLPWFKGAIGEYKVNALLEHRLAKNKYRLFKDVLLPTEDGTTQIDHIVISKYGIFVIETKNMSHWIFANNGPHWTQMHYKWKNKFQNPIRQNYKHVKSLEALLNGTEGLVFNTVVFTGNCELKTDVEKGVVKLSGLIPYIKSFQNQIIDEDRINIYADQINKNKLDNTLLNKIKHIHHVDNIKAANGQSANVFQNLFIKYAYKITLPLIFIFISLSILDGLYKQSIKMLSDTTTSNLYHRNTTKQKQHEVVQYQVQPNLSQYAQQTPQKVIMPSENKIISPKQSTIYKGAIYSWTNEKGQRVSSNVGFPTDKKYTDPRINWY